MFIQDLVRAAKDRVLTYHVESSPAFEGGAHVVMEPGDPHVDPWCRSVTAAALEGNRLADFNRWAIDWLR